MLTFTWLTWISFFRLNVDFRRWKFRLKKQTFATLTHLVLTLSLEILCICCETLTNAKRGTMIAMPMHYVQIQKHHLRVLVIYILLEMETNAHVYIFMTQLIFFVVVCTRYLGIILHVLFEFELFISIYTHQALMMSWCKV